ncbi:MAG: hypothetical protein R2876_02470 [Eubacteriales bacterium]
MKKVFLLVLIVVTVLSFSACSMFSFLDQGQQAAQQTYQYEYESAQTTQAATEEPVQNTYPQTSQSTTTTGQYEVVNGNVVKTIYTGDIKQIFTFYYQYDSIVGADIVSVCTSTVEAQAMYDLFLQTNEESNLYEDVRMEGTTVTVDYSTIAIAAYSGMTPEELRDYLN